MGVSQVRRECRAVVKSGINSREWNKQHLEKLTPAGSLIISLGANDYKGIDTDKELRKMRSNVKADRVFWISLGKDRKKEQMATIEKIAAEYGDIIIPRPESHISPDKVHPTGKGYKIIGDATK